VVARLVANGPLVDGISTFLFPKIYQRWARGARLLTKGLLHWRARQLRTVQDVQQMMRRYIDVMIRHSVTELTSSGLDHLPAGVPRLFVSNHRDIVLDTVFLNRVLHGADEPTCRMAVGDNLLSTQYAADIMRLNKSFVVERNATGTKAVYRALMRTSSYIKASLSEQESVWIAQRAGRAKDGFDRTEPALLKMLALAYRKETDSLGDWLNNVCLIPVSISYELDPCDVVKAEELLLTEQQQGEYEKPIDADLSHIVASVVGEKGRVHISFGERVTGEFDSAESLANRLDRDIVAGLQAFPTHWRAQELLDKAAIAVPDSPALAVFEQRLQQLKPELRDLVLQQYANLLRNRAQLHLPSLP